MAFRETENPRDYLTGPEVKNSPVLGQPYSNPMVLFDALSPSQWINAMINHITGYDVLDYLSKAFAGDWERVAEYSDAFSKLGQALQGIGINVSSGNVELDRAWQGNASDARWRYFTDLASETSSQQFPFDKLAEQYRQAAEGTWRAANSCQGLFSSMIDWAIMGALAAAAGAITAETVVGEAAGGAMAAWSISKIILAGRKMQTIVVTAGNTIFALAGEAQATAGDAAVFKGFPLPEGNYKHSAI